MPKLRTLTKAIVLYGRTGYKHTGERVHPFFASENFINHLKVYQYLSQFTSGKRVLDVGCGVGYGTDFITRNAASVVGIDFSAAAIKEAKRLYPSHDYRQMNAEKLEFPDNSFDFIISSESFEHLHDQPKNISEMARVLDPKGTCFIATPNPELFGFSNNKFHIRERTFTEMGVLLEKSFGEFEIVEPQNVPRNHTVNEAARRNRFAIGVHGKIVSPDLEIFGKKVDQTYLSNTHSFHCFARQPLS
jgi:ubiquinone/menaquinone biosynthesis C-methylase UbiE